MSCPKIKKILLFISSVCLVFSIIFGSLFFYVFPEYPVNIAFFKVIYNVIPAKRSFLNFYSPVRRNIRSGYAPVEVNQFLINKITVSKNENEISAIVHFYAIQAEGHRIGYFDNFSEEVKPKIIQQLIKELDDNTNLSGKLMLLEEIRSNKRLGKGSVGISGMNHLAFSTIEEYKKWFNEELEKTAKSKYQEWWNLNLSWEEKKKIDPLEGTNIKVSECCG
ncbi:MAG: hypothetical protein M3Q99_14335 [Acidobacteriota bacterium]|nr:hypothetical protein [Acidobacteriota bacterium]